MAAVELLEQHDPRELVGQRQVGPSEKRWSTSSSSSPNGPPMTKHRSRPDWRRCSRKRLKPTLSNVSPPTLEQRDERALGDPAPHVLVLADLDQLEARVAGQQLG